MAADECARRVLAARLTVAASSSMIGSWSPDATGLGGGVPGAREADGRRPDIPGRGGYVICKGQSCNVKGSIFGCLTVPFDLSPGGRYTDT